MNDRLALYCAAGPEYFGRVPLLAWVDLSNSSDRTVVVACWRVGDGYAVLPHFGCPAENRRGWQDHDRAPYVRWSDGGHLESTPGNVAGLPGG